MKRKHIGSSLDDLLRKDGTYEEVTTAAVKRVLARQLEAAMAEQDVSKTDMARRMKTSRAQLNRLLDPNNGSGDAGDAAARRCRRWPAGPTRACVMLSVALRISEPITERSLIRVRIAFDGPASPESNSPKH